jgi:hypothetical protein
VTRLDIEPTDIRGERGQRYRVLHAGGVLIEDTWNPEFDAARALVALGVTGQAEIWRDGKAVSTMDIEAAAESTIVENASVGPRLSPWMPFSPYSVAPPAGVSGWAGVMEPADADERW